MDGVRIQGSDGFADFLSLRVEVPASPHDVVEVALDVPTVVADSGDFVIKLRELDFVVAASTSGYVDVASVLEGEVFGTCPGDLGIDLLQPFGEIFQAGGGSLTAPLSRCRDDSWEELEGRVDDRDILIFSLPDI